LHDSASVADRSSGVKSQRRGSRDSVLGFGRLLKEGDSDGKGFHWYVGLREASRRRARILHRFDVRGVFLFNLRSVRDSGTDERKMKRQLKGFAAMNTIAENLRGKNGGYAGGGIRREQQQGE